MHKLMMILHDRTLTRVERHRLSPAEPKAHRQSASLGGRICRTGISCHVEAWNTQGTSSASNRHAIVQDLGWLLLMASVSTAVGFKAHTVHRTVHFWHP